MNYLNLGCGSRFHKDWVNLDKHPINPHIQKYDIQHGIPFPDNSFDVIYHSHLLEHLLRENALAFTNECFRVLKPGGVLRVVVPDLEQISRLYLLALENSVIGNIDWQQNYDWIMLELFDQASRNFPGGNMLQYLEKDKLSNKDFIISRIGEEARNIFNSTTVDKYQFTKNSIYLARFRKIPLFFRKIMTKCLLGDQDYRALQIGRFRTSGEVHYWMYDRYSLHQLLKSVGFRDINIKNAFESAIYNWQEFKLDTNAEGIVYKPDSLFMEAKK